MDVDVDSQVCLLSGCHSFIRILASGQRSVFYPLAVYYCSRPCGWVDLFIKLCGRTACCFSELCSQRKP
jgi:hypothetical protein